MITDVNVWLSRWPNRRLPLDETPQLVSTLTSLNITEAWCASLDGLLHRDLRAVNRRTVAECQQHAPGMLRPVAVINPALPGWQADLEDCRQLNIRILRLMPGWHGYDLTSPDFRQLLQSAHQARMLVQICLRLEDPRIQHTLLQIPDIDASPLLAPEITAINCRLMLLNALATTSLDLAGRLAASAGIAFDIAMLEGLAGLERLTSALPGNRIHYGSFSPVFVPQATSLKLQESLLPAPLQNLILRDNAAELLRNL